MATNYERAFAERPEVYAAWVALREAVRARLDPRRYELVTLAAAQRLRSSYCSLAHGRILAERWDDPVAAIAADRHGAAASGPGAALSPVDVAVMDLAEKVVADAAAIEEADRQPLRDLGLSDDEIMDVVLAASIRCFFSKALDALGVLPDAEYRELPADLQAVLVVGRPIAEA